MSMNEPCKHQAQALQIIDHFAAEKFTIEDGLLIIAVLLAAATADQPPDIAHRMIEDIAKTAHAHVHASRLMAKPKGRA